jgi:hypothetical protein
MALAACRAPLKLLVPAKRFPWKPAETQPLPEKSVGDDAGRSAARLRVQSAEETPSERITLVPDGVIRFRVSMFPVTSLAWHAAD